MATTSSSQTPPVRTPLEFTNLVQFLDDNFPGRSDYPAWLLDVGMDASDNLKTLRSGLRKRMPLEDAEKRFFKTIQTIINDWYAVERPEMSEPAKLRFFSFKLVLYLEQLNEEDGTA